MYDLPEYCHLRNPLIEGDPFELARKTCDSALRDAQDIKVDQSRLLTFAAQLDPEAVRNVAKGHMGENCDVGPRDFADTSEAANFAVLFSLLQFGHGFRHELHELCGRGASRTITLGVSNLKQRGLQARDLHGISLDEVREAFALPRDAAVDEFALQIWAVLQQAVQCLEELGDVDFDSFCRRVLDSKEATAAPAATLVSKLANAFPAFNDQWLSDSGVRVVFLKKATLAVGELQRLAVGEASAYRAFSDLDRAVAPIDNVIPAVLTFHGVLRLSDDLHAIIHERRDTLLRGRQEAELRAGGVVACERIVEAAGAAFNSIDLGYYLWLSGKIPEIRRFARHHTKDTVYY
jgi:hypothetical protein